MAFTEHGNAPGSEDLVQTTFVRLCRHWGRARPETLDAYTRRILVNAFLSGRRNHRRERAMADVPDTAGPSIDRAELMDLGRALVTLPPRQRAMVVLRYLEDRPVAEVAELLGVAEGTVKSQTARGIAGLRMALDAPVTTKE